MSSTAVRHDAVVGQVRLVGLLIFCFAVLPGLLIISVGVLMLVFGHRSLDYLFGILILALAVTLISGITATFTILRRGASLAHLQSEFVQRVSHDLRTPLTSIRMFVETLASGKIDAERQRECLEVLGKETDRLSALVERLLGWAKMEAGKREYAPAAITPEVVVKKAVTALQTQLTLQADGPVALEQRIAPSLPTILVDAEAMSEALLNVLQNAVRYCAGEKKIVLSVEARPKEVVFTVRDNGPGIAKEEQRRIFEKFYRVVDPARPNVAGTGLGLSIVYHIVRAHGGRIVVDSDLGKGAAFHIHLPAVGNSR